MLQAQKTLLHLGVQGHWIFPLVCRSALYVAWQGNGYCLEGYWQINKCSVCPHHTTGTLERKAALLKISKLQQYFCLGYLTQAPFILGAAQNSLSICHQYFIAQCCHVPVVWTFICEIYEMEEEHAGWGVWVAFRHLTSRQIEKGAAFTISGRF